MLRIGDKPLISYAESVKNWWYFDELKDSERKLLSTLPFFPESDGIRRSERMDVDIGEGNHIHEFYIENLEPTDNSDEVMDVVLVHGYMAALGFFYKDFELLSQIPGIRVHAIDMLGFGLSSRPNFPKFGHESPEEILEIESFFIDAVEKWRLKRGLKKFKVIAHSMGGYLMNCYIMKYNNNGEIVNDMMVVSPMGTERNEHSFFHAQNERGQLSVRNEPFREMCEDQDQTTAHKKDNVITRVSLVYEDSPLDEDQRTAAPRFPRRKWLQYLWRRHITPFQILNYTGPFYSKILSSWSFSRFKSLATEEQMHLHYYCCSIYYQQICGELAITRLVTPDILPRMPLIDRIGKDNYNHVRTMWCYGENDWMNKYGGYDVVKKLREMGNESHFRVVKRSGHHIYLDNPVDFVGLCVEFFGMKGLV